jgi:hypothetical protein
LDLSLKSYLQKYSPRKKARAACFSQHRFWVESLRPLTVRLNEPLIDALVDVLLRMVEAHVHRFWIVDDAGVPSGVFSMTDVFRMVRDCRAPGDAGADDCARAVHVGFDYSFRMCDGQLLEIDDEVCVVCSLYFLIEQTWCRWR